jgi:hypothetical protein
MKKWRHYVTSRIKRCKYVFLKRKIFPVNTKFSANIIFEMFIIIITTIIFKQ